MWKHGILILGLGVLAVGCTAPSPAATITPTATLLPVKVEVIIPATPTLPLATATASPMPTATATPVPTLTEPPPSVVPIQSPEAPLAAKMLSSETVSPPPPTAAPTVEPAPTAVPVAPLSAGVSAEGVAAAEQYMIDLINAQRTAQALPPLARDETLMGIARARVADMVARRYTGHYDPETGVGLGKALMRAAGYTSGFMGENWYGYPQGPVDAVNVAMNWFMSDSLHAANILSPNFVGVGVGLAFNGREWLVVQNFAGAAR